MFGFTYEQKHALCHESTTVHGGREVVLQKHVYEGLFLSWTELFMSGHQLDPRAFRNSHAILGETPVVGSGFGRIYRGLFVLDSCAL